MPNQPSATVSDSLPCLRIYRDEVLMMNKRELAIAAELRGTNPIPHK
jgi:hypothetical protein